MPGEQHSGILGLNQTINQKENPYIPGSDLWQLQGWYLNESLSIQKRSGFQKLNLFSLLENSVPATFTGLFEYLPSVGIPIKIGTGLTGIYTYNPASFRWEAATIPASRTGNSENLYAARMLFDQFYLGGGGSSDVNLRFNGNNWFQMGITAPSVAPSGGTPTTGGSLSAGVYSWKVTYVNELNQESNPSAVSNNVTITGGSGNYTVPVTIPVSSDSQVLKRNIYRTTANGAVWLLIATVNNNSATLYNDGNADAALGIANDQFDFGVPPHFKMIELYKGVAFMGGDSNHLSRVWFSNSSIPAAVNSNDFRDLDPNDGDILTGLIQFQSTVAAFKGYSIWVLSGQDRTTFGFTKQVTHVGSANHASLVEIPMVSMSGAGTPAEGKIAFLSPTARFYFFDGTTAVQTAVGLEPILNGLDKNELGRVVGTIVPALNQARWIVPADIMPGNAVNDLMIWYDYVLDKWGTTLLNFTLRYSALLHDNFNVLHYFVGGAPPDNGTNISGGYVYQGDIGGSDDGIPLMSEVIDRGHPKYLLNPIGQSINYPTPENIKVFSQIFIWYKTLPNPGVTLNVYGILDDPTNTPILIGTINCTHSSGQETLKMNLQGRRLYIRITETSAIQGLLIRGWKIYFKDVGRKTAI